jgi:plasmid segregation protein ParM
MADIVQAVANQISDDIGTPYRDFSAIDSALRSGRNPVIYQKPYDISRMMPLASSRARQAVPARLFMIALVRNGMSHT